MSLNHNKLYARICWGLKRQFPEGGELYRTLKYLWHEIIFDNPTKDVRIRGKKSAWDELPADKSLFFQPDTLGIVIGNLTSQLLSNIYLDQLDRYITIILGYKNYGRYVDDFFIIITEAELPQLLKDLDKVEHFVEKLGLHIHPKKKFEIPAEKGVDFIGAKIYWDHIIPGERISKNYANKAYRLATTGQGKLESISSYDGHLSNFNSHKLGKKIYDGVGWDYAYPKLKKKRKN